MKARTVERWIRSGMYEPNRSCIRVPMDGRVFDRFAPMLCGESGVKAVACCNGRADVVLKVGLWPGDVYALARVVRQAITRARRVPVPVVRRMIVTVGTVVPTDRFTAHGRDLDGRAVTQTIEVPAGETAVFDLSSVDRVEHERVGERIEPASAVTIR